VASAASRGLAEMALVGSGLAKKSLGLIVRSGSLGLIDGAGGVDEIGDGSTPSVIVRMSSRRLDFSLAINPSLSIGEAYMDGSLVIEQGNIFDFLDVLARNADRISAHPWFGLLERASTFSAQHNPIGRARRNVAHHYDLSGKLYDTFLDRDRQYSCAYFTDDAESLESAQLNKKRHIAAKLLLDRPGLHILDIGSGWGGLGLYLAWIAQADVTGVTLGTEQHKVSNERTAEAGLTGRVRFELRDYREQSGQFDRIVSVGMFEHVGKKNYPEFFARLRDLLADDGIALLHAVGVNGTPRSINPFIRKYIFPGADTPSLSEVAAAIEHSGLVITDIEVLRLHYAETLRLWRERFTARRAEVEELYDERFCRMWEFYLASCEIAFRDGWNIVFQVQLTKRLDAAPTRGWTENWERADAAASTDLRLQ
jgi:cyclopropane-fatty-acyl-phospholipid synthase